MTEAIIPDIPNIKAHWDHPGVDPVPYLMVPMSDKTIIRYNPEIQHPGTAKALDNIRRLSEMRNGYQPDDMIPGTNHDGRYFLCERRGKQCGHCMKSARTF